MESTSQLPVTPDDFVTVRRPLEQAAGLGPKFYIEPSIYELELRRIFKREWICVDFHTRVTKPGDYFTTDMAGEPLLVVRDLGGKIRTFINACQHKGMLVAQGAGNARSFRCPYHAWTYDTGGKLKMAPSMERAEGFKLSDIKLKEVQTEVWNGFIFINFRNDAPPLGPQIDDLSEILRPWNISAMAPVYQYEVVGDWNWKVMVENANEAYHVIEAHRQSAQEFAPGELSYSTDDDGRYWQDMHAPFAAAGLLGGGICIPDLPTWVEKRFSFFALPPNFLISMAREGVTTYHTIPLGAQKTRYLWTVYVPTEFIKSPDMEAYLEASKPLIKMINEEDAMVCAGTQRGMGSSGWNRARYSHLEKGVWQFHRWYADRILGS